jgi:glycosyltransferase involved in cell wall biosynthesis
LKELNFEHEKKICHVDPFLSAKADGIYSHIKSLIQNVNPTFKHIIIFGGFIDAKRSLEELGVKSYFVPELEKKISFSVLFKLLNILRKENVDIIHAHALKSYILCGIINIFLRKKMIYNDHGVFIDSEYHNRLGKSLLLILHRIINSSGSVDAFITPSKYCKKRLLTYTNFSTKIKVYSNGTELLPENNCDNELMRKINRLKEKNIIIGIVGRIAEEKRIDRNLMIINRLIKKGYMVHAFILGDGPLWDVIDRLILDLRIEKDVSLLGYVKNAKAYFPSFDFILLTSDREGMPLIVWEAMAQAVPIISTDVGGIREIIEANNCGLIFSRESINDGVNLCEKLINDPGLRKELGKNGKNAIEKKYSMDNFKSFFNRLYFSLINAD